jgi:hypothetical protein
MIFANFLPLFMLNSSNFLKSHLSMNFPVGEPAVGELGVGELACR